MIDDLTTLIRQSDGGIPVVWLQATWGSGSVGLMIINTTKEDSLRDFQCIGVENDYMPTLHIASHITHHKLNSTSHPIVHQTS